MPKTWSADLTAGFSVFLIALPLCLGISLASGFPATAGLVTAIVGGILGSLISRAELVIKGPAAGLIVIALGSVTELGPGDPGKGYVLTLGVCVVAGLVQVLLAVGKFGKVMDICPPTPVHGMMASIGIIIAVKQIHIMLGTTPVAKTPLALISEIPRSVASMNPEIAIIGAATLLTLVKVERLRKKWPRLAPPMFAIAVAVPLGLLFDLGHEHTLAWLGRSYLIGPKALLHVPEHIVSELGHPDFSALGTGTGVKYVIMFALVGSLESLLSTRAVDRLDPLKRKSDLNRDLLATGVGNAVAAAIGGLPMISEIVRSSANVAAGAKSRLANAFHGVFLLVMLALASQALAYIPLASLAALLVYTGARLAAPKQLLRLAALGWDQLVVFFVTVLITLATDLLMGVASGIVVELVLLSFRANPLSLFRARLQVEKPSAHDVVVSPEGPLTFLNLQAVRKALVSQPQGVRVTLDLSKVTLVDHASMMFLRSWNALRSERDAELLLHNTSALRPLAKSDMGLHLRAA